MSGGILVAVTDLRATSPRVHTFLDRETGATIDFTFRAGEAVYMPLKLAEHMIRRPEDYPDFDVRFAAEVRATAPAVPIVSPPPEASPPAEPPPPEPPVQEPPGEPPGEPPTLTPAEVRQGLYDVLTKAGVPFSKNAPTARLMALAQEAAKAAAAAAEPTA